MLKSNESLLHERCLQRMKLEKEQEANIKNYEAACLTLTPNTSVKQELREQAHKLLDKHLDATEEYFNVFLRIYKRQ